MAREYGVDNGDGTISVWGTDDAGNFWPVRTETKAQNQGTQARSSATAPTGMNVGGGGQWYSQAGDLANSAANQQYLRDRLGQVDLPAFRLQQLLGEAGLTGYYTPGGKPMSEDEQLDYIWQKWPGLQGVAQANGHDVSSPEKIRAFLKNNWLPGNAQGKTIAQVAEGFGLPAGGFSAAAGDAAGARRTFAGEQFDEGKRQWGLARDDSNRQYYTSFLGSKTGPRDWAIAQALRPEGAFGAMQGSPSWEGALVDFARSGNSQPTAAQGRDWWEQGSSGTVSTSGALSQLDQLRRSKTHGQGGSDGYNIEANTALGYGRPTTGANPFGSIRQPTAIRPQDWWKKGGAGQEMQRGLWSAQGVDPEDAERNMKAAWPTGRAAAATYWR